MTTRTFNYAPVPKPVKSAKVIPARVKPESKPIVPIDTAEFTDKVVTAIHKFKPVNNSKFSVLFLDDMAHQFGKIHKLIARGEKYRSQLAVAINHAVSRLTMFHLSKEPSLRLGPVGHSKHAASMLALANRRFAEAAGWLERDGDKLYLDFSMVAMCIGDAADYLHISNYILVGNRSEACKISSHQDTSPRDEIPSKVWDWIQVGA
jgi:hypothetical protein